MSKMDNLRAMREARYAAARAGAATPSAAAPRTAKPSARTRPSVATERASGSPTGDPTSDPTTGSTKDPSDEPGAATGLCGHRNMGGRTCTREAGHAAKSHRYS